jgi:hypothetical protein
METVLNLIGLLFTAVGAWLAARSVIIKPKHAKALSETRWDSNHDLEKALLAQSRAARNGLLWSSLGPRCK